MKSYTKKYMLIFGYDESSFIPCEICGKRAESIHHIISRSRDKSLLNEVSNCMALCMEDHLKYGDKVQYMDFLQLMHRKFMLKNAK